MRLLRGRLGGRDRSAGQRRTVTPYYSVKITCCLHCGGPIAEMSEQEYAVRFPGNAGQPPADAAPAPAAQQPRQADPAAPLCGRCGVNKVNRRRNRSWFPTCFACG